MVPIAASAPTVVPIAASAPTDADSPRRASFSWLQHAETAILDDDWLRLGDEDDDDINCSLGATLQLADFRLNASPRRPRLREADLTRVAADVGRRSFARSPKPPMLSRTNTSVSSSDCSSPRTTSISDSSRTPSPPPPRTLKRSSSWSAGTALPPMPARARSFSQVTPPRAAAPPRIHALLHSPLKLSDHHSPVARRLLLPDVDVGARTFFHQPDAVGARAHARVDDLIDDLALFLELHE